MILKVLGVYLVMFENIKITKQQLKDACIIHKRISLSVETEISGAVEHDMILCSDLCGYTYVFSNDDERPNDFYYVNEFSIEITDRDRLLSEINKMHGNRITFKDDPKLN